MIFTFYVSGKINNKCVRIKFYKLLFLKFQLVTMYLQVEQLNKEINMETTQIGKQNQLQNMQAALSFAMFT